MYGFQNWRQRRECYFFFSYDLDRFRKFPLGFINFGYFLECVFFFFPQNATGVAFVAFKDACLLKWPHFRSFYRALKRSYDILKVIFENFRQKSYRCTFN